MSIKDSNSKRKSIKALLGGSGIVASQLAMQENWIRPVISTAVLPAHAQASFQFLLFLDVIEVEDNDSFVATVENNNSSSLEIFSNVMVTAGEATGSNNATSNQIEPGGALFNEASTGGEIDNFSIEVSTEGFDDTPVTIFETELNEFNS